MITRRNPIYGSIAALALMVLITAGGPAALYAMAGKKAKEPMKLIRTAGDIEEYRLMSNGLTVLLKQDHAAPVVAVMVSYAVGSRNEADGATGAAHLLEHMMFKGTEKYRRSRGTSVAQLLEGAGAMLNANTGHDATHYYEMLPSDKLELALDIEADRMQGSLLDGKDFEAERQVVLNELERYFDNPSIDLTTKIWQTAYQDHPYHHPIIGWREDVKTMPVDAAKALYRSYYQPANAVLTICGDFQKDAVLKLVTEKFADLESAPAPAFSAWTEGPQGETRRVDIQREKGSPSLVIAHRMPGALDPDSIKLDLLALILSRGKTSRLFQKLVQPGLAAKAETGSSGTRDPGLFSTYVTLTADLTHEQAEQKVLEVYADIRENGVTPEELQRALTQLEADIAFARDGVFSLVSELSYAIGFGDWQYFVNYLDLARAVTAADLRDAARRYWKPESMTVGRLIIGSAREGVPSEAGGFSHETHSEGPVSMEQELPADIRRLMQGNGKVRTESYASRAEILKDENLTMIFYPTESENIVSLSGSFDFAGTAYHRNPFVPAFASLMLDKGTQRRSKLDVAEILESRGAQIQFAADYEHARFNAKFLSRDLAVVLELIFEQLRMPAFDEEEFRKAKQRHRVAIEQAMASTSSVGLNHLINHLFPEGHPHHNYSFEEQLRQLDALNIEDVRTFYNTHYGPQNLIVAVSGDFDRAAAAAGIRAGLEGWLPQAEGISYPAALAGGESGRRESVSVPGVVNNDVFMGHVIPLTRLDPDYVGLYAANYILGGDFSARLSSVIRDRYGYTYGIRSGIMGVSESLNGAWVIHLIVNPSLLDKAVEQTKIELERFAREGVSEKELGNAKRMIAGKFKVGLATIEALSSNLLQVEERGLGVGYLDRFTGEVEALEYAQVNSLIRRYYKPDTLYIVSAGPERG